LFHEKATRSLGLWSEDDTIEREIPLIVMHGPENGKFGTVTNFGDKPVSQDLTSIVAEERREFITTGSQPSTSGVS